MADAPNDPGQGPGPEGARADAVPEPEDAPEAAPPLPAVAREQPRTPAPDRHPPVRRPDPPRPTGPPSAPGPTPAPEDSVPSGPAPSASAPEAAVAPASEGAPDRRAAEPGGPPVPGEGPEPAPAETPTRALLDTRHPVREPGPTFTANASTEAPSAPHGEPRSEIASPPPTAPVSVPREGGAPAAVRSGTPSRARRRGGGGAEAVGEPGGAPPEGRGRRRRVALAVVCVLVAGAVAAGAVALSGGDAPDGGSAISTGGAATATSAGGSSGSARPTVEGTSRPPSLPPGARREAGGYAWVPPEGWRRDLQTGAEVHYTSPDATQELVAKSSLAKGDLMDSWRTSEQNARQGRDYRKIRLEETTFRGRPAVAWEYTFTLKGVSWHARLLGFDAEGTSYQINTWYHQDREAAAVEVYDTVKKSFTVL